MQCNHIDFVLLYRSLSLLYYLYFFFFKQKTAYEMRISDWSSDVCSSDLAPEAARRTHRPAERLGGRLGVGLGREGRDLHEMAGGRGGFCRRGLGGSRSRRRRLFALDDEEVVARSGSRRGGARRRTLGRREARLWVVEGDRGWRRVNLWRGRNT